MMVQSAPRESKRSDIQALRGVAVLAVLLYHYGFPLPGGYLGVDMFFVISGYVITQSLSNLEGTISSKILQFYRKRFRRIIPASTLVVFFTLLMCVLFLPKIYIHNFGLEALSCFFMVGNFVFAINGTDYLNQTLHISPFLHYWSLGIEEQFYAFWPVLYFKFVKRLNIATLLALISLGICLLTTHLQPIWSFYSPASRTWEFLIGCSVAMRVKKHHSLRLTKIGSAISICTIVLSLFFVSNHFSTPSLWNLPIACATAVIILLERQFEFPTILTYLGNISFSLYLVHWPIYAAFLFYLNHVTLVESFILLLSSVALAHIITFRFENPIRFRGSTFQPLRIALSLGCVVFFLTSAAAVFGETIYQQASRVAPDTSIPEIYQNGCHVNNNVVEPKKVGCFFGDTNSLVTVMLVGDSHAAQYFPGFAEVASSLHLRLAVATKSGCPMLELTELLHTDNSGCRRWEENTLYWINFLKPNVLVVSNSTEAPTGGFHSLGLSPDAYVKGLGYLKTSLSPKIQMAVIGDTPYPYFDIPTCLVLHHKNQHYCDLPNSKSLATKLTSQLSSKGIFYVDSRAFFCKYNVCPAILQQKNVYRDGSHLSSSMARIEASILKRIVNHLQPNQARG